MPFRILLGVVCSIVCALCSFCQESSPSDPTQPLASGPNQDSSQIREKSRILGIIPNNRTYPNLRDYVPLTAGQKFKIATDDALDRGTVVLAALFGAEGQITNANRSFGQGVAGYARYFGASYGDLLIGDYMTEAVFPTLLRQDPRYFRKGSGSGWSRVAYAVEQIFWTHRDSGGTQFNYSEIVGNSAAVAISNAYYADNRTAGKAASRLAVQIGVDMSGNILKEFWPDLQRKLRRHHDTNKAH
jgi:hypothetical protein